MKKLLLGLLLVLALCAFSACSYQFPDGFDEAAVLAKGEEAIALAGAADWDALLAMFRPDIQETLTAQELADQLEPLMSKTGAFQRIKGTATAGTRDEATAEPYAIAGIKCLYENGRLTYTLTFDSDLYLVGFFVK